ncbi:acyl carrier protein [Actinoplanes sp. G11-F43]|uniref:acyl carrier protein n=1 Tax=Actinoplanes sp. G11-F43 TaxID=3424130 RepID=UPI003D358943
MTLDDIRRLLRESGGVDESVDIDGDIADTELSALGYDSLAVLEMCARIEQQYGVKIPEEELTGLTTPAAVIAYVDNARAIAAS